MDVLQLLKTEFKDRSLDMTYVLDGTSASDMKAILNRICVHLTWEANFLFPELAAITASSDAILTRYTQSLQDLRKQAQLSLNDKSGESTKELAQRFLKHSQWVEEKVLTLMRQKIPTAEREELYHVFADAKHDLSTTPVAEFVI